MSTKLEDIWYQIWRHLTVTRLLLIPAAAKKNAKPQLAIEHTTGIFLIHSFFFFDLTVLVAEMQLFPGHWKHYQISPLYSDIFVLCKLNSTVVTIW